MGLIVHDVYSVDSNSGLEIKDIYINLGDVVVSKKTDVIGYKIFYVSQYFFNKQARLDNKVPLLNKSQTLEFYSLPVNIYEYIYNDVKTNFSSYSDD